MGRVTGRRAARVVAAAVLALGMAAHVEAQTSTMNAQEKANLQFVLDWWRDVLQARHTELSGKYQADDYIQHNINIKTGRQGFVDFFSKLGPPVNPIPAKLTSPPVVSFGKGDYVLLVWEREGKDPADPDQDLQVQHLRPDAAAERQGAGALGLGAEDSRRSRLAARPTAWTTTP